MAFSFQTYVGSAGNTDFAFDFPYLKREHVKVKVDGNNVQFSFLNDSTVRLATAPQDGAAVLIQRVTPLSAAPVDYNDGSVLREFDLDTAVLYNLYVVQELKDQLDADVQLGLGDSELLNNASFNYDVAMSVPYAPDNEEVLLNLVMTTNVRLAQNASGSTAYARIPALGGNAVFSIQRNGVEVGTLTYLAGSNVGSFAVPAEVVFAIGDRLDIVAPALVPLNFRGMGVVLRTRRITVA